MLKMQLVPHAGLEAEAEYQYQVVETPTDEVGMMVARSQRFDCKADALYVKHCLLRNGYDLAGGRLRLAIHVTRKES